MADTTTAVPPTEVYAMAAAAWDRTHASSWQWANLTAGERDEWLTTAAPIVRAVLEMLTEGSSRG